MVSCFAVAVAALLIGGEPRIEKAGRIVFLGDSITHAGTYVQDVEAFLLTRYPDQPRMLLNLGLSSETASGLSENNHPGPRPCVHERLTRALDAAKPDLVVACYGMNDGIYHPFGETRFAAYRSGMERLHDQAARAGASVVIVTPLPFDVRPVAHTARPLGAEDYGYQHPYVDYDQTLTRYAEWLVGKRSQGWTVVDAHSSALAVLNQGRELQKSFAIAGDGVHPDAAGHWLIADALLSAWGLPTEVDRAEIDAGRGVVVQGRVDSLIAEKGGLTFIWTTRVPMPHAPGWNRRPVGSPAVSDRFNDHRLVVKGFDAPRVTLYEDDRKIGEVDRVALAEGIDLTNLPELSTNQRSRAIRPLVEARERLLSAAWLSAVGHKRSGIAPGLPLDEAKTRADALESEIRRLAHPIPIKLRLVPVAG